MPHTIRGYPAPHLEKADAGTVCRHILPTSFGRAYLEKTVDLWRPFIVESTIKFCRPWAEPTFFVISSTADEASSTGVRASGSDGEWLFFALEPDVAIRTGMVTQEAYQKTLEGWENVRGPLDPDLLEEEGKAKQRHRQYVNAEKKKDEARTAIGRIGADVTDGLGGVLGGLVAGVASMFGSAGRAFFNRLGPTGSALLVGGVVVVVLYRVTPIGRVVKGLNRS